MLRLDGKDFNWKKGMVSIKPFKYGKHTFKPILPASVKVIKKLMKGVVVTRTRARGALGIVKEPDRWHWSKGSLFPSERADADSALRNKDIVSKVC